MPQLTAGFLIQIVYNVLYFLISSAIKAKGNKQLQEDFDGLCVAIEKMFTNLK
jgi:hypothetical protein